MNPLRHLPYALRSFRKNPGFAAVAALTLAIGLGANAAVFSIVYQVLLRPLPYQDPDRLVMVWGTHRQRGWDRNSVSAPDFLDLKAAARNLSGVAAFAPLRLQLSGDGDPEEVAGARVSADLFPLLGVKPEIGGLLPAGGDLRPGVRSAVLDHRFWRRRFAADPKIVGRTVRLNGEPYNVVGVMPAAFEFPPAVSVGGVTPEPRADLWVPLELQDQEREARGYRFLRVLARLAPGATLASAEAEAASVAAHLERQFPDSNAETGLRLAPLPAETAGGGRAALLILAGAAGLVLLVTFANLINLLLARGAVRRRELALRTALGADRREIAGQLLAEAGLLALLGGALGLALAIAATNALLASFAGVLGQVMPRLEPLRLAPHLLAAALLLIAAAATVVGLVSLLDVRRLDLRTTLQEGGRTATAGAARRRLRALLVVAQIALAFVLVVGMTLLLRSFLHLMDADPGFRVERALTFRLYLPESKHPEGHQLQAFNQAVLERLETLPGVEAAGAVSLLPLGGSDRSLDFEVRGRPAPSAGEKPAARYRLVTRGYFQALGIPLAAGRYLDERDHAEAPLAVVIDQRMARTFWPGGSPLDQEIVLMGGPSARVVGVVGDVRHAGLDAESNPTLYLSYQQVPGPVLTSDGRSMTFVVRTSQEPAALFSGVRRRIHELDRGQPVADLKSMESVLSGSLSQRRFSLVLLGAYALLTLLLASVGVYGIVACSVNERRQELGVRMAMGADRRDILRLVLGWGGRMALAGTAAGIAVSLACVQALRGLVVGVSVFDVRVFLGTAAVLLGLALLASYSPARLAAATDPNRTLDT